MAEKTDAEFGLFAIRLRRRDIERVKLAAREVDLPASSWARLELLNRVRQVEQARAAEREEAHV